MNRLILYFNVNVMIRFAIALIPVVAAIAVALDAKSRRMNPWLWGILTFFFTLITVIVYLFVRKPKYE